MDELGPDLLWKLKHSPIHPSYSGLQGKGTLSSRSKGALFAGDGKGIRGRKEWKSG